MDIRKNEILEVPITDLTNTGEGIGHYEGYTLFVKDALPGDVVAARVTRPKKGYAYARTEKILAASPHRVSPPCPEARRCGGCTLQALSYKEQCRYKEEFVRRNLSRIGGFADPPVLPILSAAEPFRYRNKAQYPIAYRFDDQEQLRPAAGYYAARTHVLIPIDDCLLSPAHHREILDVTLDFCARHKIPPYDEKSGTGLLRHILIRDGFQSGEIMLCLVINGRELPAAEELVRSLCALPAIGAKIKSICLNVNEENTNVILGETVIPLFGKPRISDTLCGLSFSVSPQSFYQVNHAQTERLYAVVKDYAGLTGKEEVLDLFCGIGTISLFLADAAKQVTGVEIVPQAISDAKENAERNGIQNASFFTGAAETLITSKKLPRADVVVLDPPRKGCEAGLIDALRSLLPEKIIYVSCDSATLARDLKRLCAEGTYRVDAVQPVDLFPQTCHVEAAALLERRRNICQAINSANQ